MTNLVSKRACEFSGKFLPNLAPPKNCRAFCHAAVLWVLSFLPLVAHAACLDMDGGGWNVRQIVDGQCCALSACGPLNSDASGIVEIQQTTCEACIDNGLTLVCGPVAEDSLQLSGPLVANCDAGSVTKNSFTLSGPATSSDFQLTGTGSSKCRIQGITVTCNADVSLDGEREPQSKRVICIDAMGGPTSNAAEGYHRQHIQSGDDVYFTSELRDCLLAAGDEDSMILNGHGTKGGGVFKWGGKKYAGFAPTSGTGGTGAPYPPFRLPADFAAVSQVELRLCDSNLALEGEISVTASFQNSLDQLATVTGASGLLGYAVGVRLSGGTNLQKLAAESCLILTASAAGIAPTKNKGENISKWALSLRSDAASAAVSASLSIVSCPSAGGAVSGELDYRIGGVEPSIPELAHTASYYCGQCGTPVTLQQEPLTSDCLYLLRTGVGSASCNPQCMCDVNLTGSVSSSDALVCLKRAVGQGDVLGCSCQ